jgi:predicted ATP-grasp superfamily ATP-dependent carboligase
MAERRPHAVIAGVSTRAWAASAWRAGYRVTAVDAFGDADLRSFAHVLPLRRESGVPYTADDAALAACAVRAGYAAYTSNFENHPDAVAVLARRRRLLGNPPSVLRRVRNPILLMRRLAALGFAVPETRASAPPRDGGAWLLKPRKSGGGHGTSHWRRGDPVPRQAYLQRCIPGVPGSVVFAADGRHAVVLGLTRQLVGDPAFGASGFRYCGSLLASSTDPLFERQPELLEAAASLASAATATFGLRGLNGIDFIARAGVPYPIEVNPRYSASMELVERATRASLFALHVQACAGRLGAAPRPIGRTFGKAIVYARADCVVGDPARWTGAPIADVPHSGERIGRGRPICTVFAADGRAGRCLRLLRSAAARVHRATALSTRATAQRGAA